MFELRRWRRRCEERYATSALFRNALASSSPSSSRRKVTTNDGRHFRFMATLSGGDCGFQAISWALIVANAAGPDMCSALVRKALRDEVANHREYYASLAESYLNVQEDTSTELVQDEHTTSSSAAEAVDHFLKSVLIGGLTGHWLGQQWGNVEIVAIARAYKLHIELFAFDVATQTVRGYFEEKAGDLFVGLLFTGSAADGHFDVLVPQSFRRWRRPVQAKNDKITINLHYVLARFALFFFNHFHLCVLLFSLC